MIGTRDEAGAGTVLAVAMLGILVFVTVATAGVVGVVAAHRRAQTAADLAALAGAVAAQEGRHPCGRAGRVAARNGAALRRCQLAGPDMVVVVATEVNLPGGALELRARSRAGPAR